MLRPPLGIYWIRTQSINIGALFMVRKERSKNCRRSRRRAPLYAFVRQPKETWGRDLCRQRVHGTRGRIALGVTAIVPSTSAKRFVGWSTVNDIDYGNEPCSVANLFRRSHLYKSCAENGGRAIGVRTVFWLLAIERIWFWSNPVTTSKSHYLKFKRRLLDQYIFCNHPRSKGPSKVMVGGRWISATEIDS